MTPNFLSNRLLKQCGIVAVYYCCHIVERTLTLCWEVCSSNPILPLILSSYSVTLGNDIIPQTTFLFLQNRRNNAIPVRTLEVVTWEARVYSLFVSLTCAAYNILSLWRCELLPALIHSAHQSFRISMSLEKLKLSR